MNDYEGFSKQDLIDILGSLIEEQHDIDLRWGVLRAEIDYIEKLLEEMV